MAWYDASDALPRHPDVDAYLEDLDAGVKQRMETLRSWIHQAAQVKETLRWGVPFFFLTAPLLYLSPAKAHITLGFAKGILVKDPKGLLTGTGKSPIRKATLKHMEPLPEREIKALIRAAVKVDGVEI